MRTLTIILTWLLLALGAGGQSITTSTPNYDRTFYARKYGAIPGDSGQDKTGLQNAIAAAAAAGGGVVQLEAGNYRVSPVATGLGLMVPNNVILRGVGPATVITGYTATSSTAFCVIANDNYNDTATDYGADVMRVEDLTVSVDATSGGNSANCHALVGVGHAASAYVRRVNFTGCYYHAVESNRSGSPAGGVLIQDCTFTGSYNQSMPLELDGGGAMGQVSGTPRTKRVGRTLIERCYFSARPATDGISQVQHILLNHNAADITEEVTILDCVFDMVNPSAFVPVTNAVAVDTAFRLVRNLKIEGCVFNGANRCNQYPVYLANDAATEVYDGVTIRGNTFKGRYREGIVIGATAGATTATLQSTRRGITIENNNFAPELSVNPYDSGLATAGASGTLTDSTRSWSTNGYANATVSIVSGTGVGQTKTITSNTGTVLTISGTFSPVPDSTSYYRIDRQYGAAVTTGTVTDATTTVVTDSTRQWVADELQGMYITFTSGALSGTTRQITDNTATTVTHGSATAATAGDTYRIDTTPVWRGIYLGACYQVNVTGNRWTYPYDCTGTSSASGSIVGLVLGTCRNVYVAGNHQTYLHTPSQLGAQTGGYWLPYWADLTKLQTNSQTSVFTALNNTADCGSSAIWYLWYEPTNSDSRTASWTYITGRMEGNVLLSGSTSGGHINYFPRNPMGTGSFSQAQSMPTVASAATIAPATRAFIVSGSTTINTITALPVSGNGLGNEIVLIPDAGATWATGTSGNIAIASTAVVGKALHMTYDPQTAKWYPSY